MNNAYTYLKEYTDVRKKPQKKQVMKNKRNSEITSMYDKTIIYVINKIK